MNSLNGDYESYLNANVKKEDETYNRMDFIKEEIDSFDIVSQSEDDKACYVTLVKSEEHEDIDVKKEIPLLEDGVVDKDFKVESADGSEVDPLLTDSSSEVAHSSGKKDFVIQSKKCSNVSTEKVVVSPFRSDDFVRRSFKCDVCSKDFMAKEGLVRHMRIHTGEKPFVCNVCEKGFTQSPSLKSHLQLHSGDKPFECDICNKRFARKANLKLHSLTHSEETPFVCDVCQKGFKQNRELKIHWRIHSGEKPYICNICMKQFARHQNLKDHLRIHSGDKPFVCEVCQRSFNQRSTLNRHSRTHR